MTRFPQARFELARLYLDDRNITLEEVSSLLGYSEARAFTRAFRRWTGVTPGKWRQRS